MSFLKMSSAPGPGMQQQQQQFGGGGMLPQQQMQQQMQQQQGGGGVQVQQAGGVGAGGVDPKVVGDIYACVQQLTIIDQRAVGLMKLVNIYKQVPDISGILAPILWHSFGVVAILLQEIVSLYPFVVSSSPIIQNDAINMLVVRANNAITLLSTIAGHHETKIHFLNAHIPLYLYPFVSSNERLFEPLRFTSLLIVASLVKAQQGQQEIVKFLLSSEFFPGCVEALKCDVGDTRLDVIKPKAYAIYILSKILSDDLGLQYSCDNQKRFNDVTVSLTSIINKVVDIVKSPEARQDEIQTATRVLNFAVRCFCRLSEYRATREILRQILPDALKTHGLAKKLQSEEEVIAMITQINQNLMPQQPGGGNTSSILTNNNINSNNNNSSSSNSNSNSSSSGLGQNKRG